MLMKNLGANLILTCLSLVVLVGCQSNDSDDVVPILEENVTVSKWYDGSSAAVSFIWDDNNISQFVFIEPMFRSLGYRTSFGVITSQIDKYTTYYKDLVKHGHELCSHTHSHRDLTSLKTEDIKFEMEESKNCLTKEFGVNPTTLIHPHNRTNSEVNSIFEEEFLFSRIYSNKEDLNRVIYNMSSGSNLPRLISSFNDARDGKWLICAGHGSDGYGFEPLKSTDLLNFLLMLKSSEDIVWVDSFSNVALYSELRDLIRTVVINGKTIVIDDSQIKYQRYSKYNVERLPITIVVDSNTDEYEFLGDNILIQSYKNDKYYITIDLLKGTEISYIGK
jgi:peptidoglycan/xylan/chitin deacetylase (PgdA/CDA1 family)